MRPASIVRWSTAFLALICALLLQGRDLAGQTPPRRYFRSGIRTGIGVTPVIPDVMAGAGAWHLFGSGRFGAFADAKMSFPDLKNDVDYCPDVVVPCTVPDVEAQRFDIKLRDVDQYLVFNAGGVVTAGPEVAFLLGVGAARHARFGEYSDGTNDPELRITDDGSYWAPHVPASEWRAQAVLGVLMRLGSRIVVRFGYETAPGGISAGGYWVFSH